MPAGTCVRYFYISDKLCVLTTRELNQVSHRTNHPRPIVQKPKLLYRYINVRIQEWVVGAFIPDDSHVHK